MCLACQEFNWPKLALAGNVVPANLCRDGMDVPPKRDGALLENEQDVYMFEQLAFMTLGQR